MTTRVVLAEDSFLVREGVRRMLESVPELEVASSVGDYDALVEAVEQLRPQVVLTDIRMPPRHTDEGLRAAELFRRLHPEMGVVLLSQYVEADYVRVLLSQGTEGRAYLLKERVGDLDELVSAIEKVAVGGSVIDPKVVEALIGVQERRGGLSELTPRETEVVAAMAEGLTNAAVARRLVLSQKAVERHINSIFSKLGLSGDTELHPRVRAVLMYLAGERR